jgi:hypothetical protein
VSFDISEENQLLYFQNLRFRPLKHLKMIVWTSILWKTNIQLEKLWPNMVKLLKNIIVIWIESEYTVKLGNKEQFDTEQIGIRNHFLWPICHLLHKDKELLALRNNFMATKKFLIAKFDCILSCLTNSACVQFLEYQIPKVAVL